MKTKKMTIEPFGVTLMVGTSDEAWKEHHSCKSEAYGYTLRHKGAWWILLQDQYQEDTVWHEAHHVARQINDHHGIDTTADDHEADVYLQEHIVRLIKSVYFNKKGELLPIT